MTLEIGTTVKPSAYSLRSAWEYYLSRGRHDEKAQARQRHDQKATKRGTVTAILGPDSVEVLWTDGSQSHCLDYMVEAVTHETTR